MGLPNMKEFNMPNAVVENWDDFKTFLSAQPLCRWSAEKQQQIASGSLPVRSSGMEKSAAAKDDNADLVAALSAMA